MFSKQMNISILYGFIAFAFAFYVYKFMGHDREVESLGVLLFKLIPFIFASLFIATIDVDLVKKGYANLFFIYAGFLIFFGLFVPRIFWEGFENESKGLYYIVLIMVPFIILLVGFAFRMGGAAPETTLRLLFSMLLIMLSGIEDLAYLVTTPGQGPIPEVWHWASHIKVRLGHFPTKYEAYAFISVHLILAIFVTTYSFQPLQRLKFILGK